jgi:hypothetical protein
MPTIQSDEVALLPAALVRTRFGTRAASWVIVSIQDRFSQNADDVPGAIQSVEVGSSDAVRDFEIPMVSLFSLASAFVPGCLSSDFQLPGTLGGLVASLSSFCYLFYPC